MEISRKEIAIKICHCVYSENCIATKEISYSRHHSKEYKNGLYFVFDDTNHVIYIGKVGSGKTASLYMRCIGNGNKSHLKEMWYRQHARFVKFHKFPNYSDEQLLIAERIAILYEKPTFNDQHTDIETLKKYVW